MTLEQRIREASDGVPYPYKGNLREAAVDIRKLEDRIKQLEEELMEVKNKYSVLVADVVLDEDKADRIKQLEDRIRRASIAFFEDAPDYQIAIIMWSILEEEARKP